jgi:hypothetical protein
LNATTFRWTRAAGSWPTFSSFPLKIWKVIHHESCVPWKSGQVSYWEILKCLGEIWRTRQKFRRTFKDIAVSVGFDCAFTKGWPRVCVDLIKRVIRVCWRGFRCDDPGLTNVSRFDSVDLVISVNDPN